MKVWLLRDPRGGRIAAQLIEPDEGSFPVGDHLRKTIWPMVQGEINDRDWIRLTAGLMPADEQDAVHQDAWDAAGGAPWPA